MIDIHSHILPGFDDGARDIFDTLEMVEIAEKSGITTIVATPHCNIPGAYTNYFGEEYKECIQMVREAVRAEGMSVKILPGAEIFGTPEVPELLQQGKLMTLNNSRYLLMEFDFGEDPDIINMILDEVRTMKVLPVIAHAERYTCVQRDPNLVYDWRSKGYPIQINKGSFRGKFGRVEKEIAYLLMEHHLVSVIASDAHRPDFRTPNMKRAFEELSMAYPDEYLDMVFEENPRRICMNEPILGLKAMMIE